MSNFAQNPRFDGKIVYLPKIDQLRRGDILLTSNRESANRREMKASGAIRRATGSNFSHAMICSTPPTFIEAIGTGVSTLSLGRCFAFDINNVRLLRYPDASVADRAAQLAQDEIGRDYSVARAVRSVFPSALLDRVDDHGVFCSALVAQVFSVAGGTLLVATPADRTTPATIEHLQGLKDITSRAFRTGLAPSNIENMSSLDGDRAPTPSAKQTVISAKCARLLWPRAHSLSIKYPELGLAVGATLYGILRFIVDAMDKKDTISCIKRIDFDRELRELDDSLNNFISEGDLEKLLIEIVIMDSNEMAQNIEESFKSDANIDIEAMKSYLIVGIQQLDVRLNSINELEAQNVGRSRALITYIKIDRIAAMEVGQRNTLLKEILERRGILFDGSSFA